MMVWLLRIAASLMLFVIITVDVLLCVVWAAAGIIEGAINKIPFWVILIAALISFGQVLISAFLYGVARQLTADTQAAVSEANSFGDRFSNTLDDGWKAAIRATWIFAATLSVFVVVLVAVFFQDLKFLAGIHRGMELESEHDYKGAQYWFKTAMNAGDKERLTIARFMYSGTLLRARELKESESELLKTLSELDPQNEDQQGLYVYTLFGLANCYQFQNKLTEAESCASKAVQMIELHPLMLGLSVRMIGSYKQFLIPNPPPLDLALSSLNGIYIKQGRLELALQTYDRILEALSKQHNLTNTDFYLELYRFQDQLSKMKEKNSESIFNQAKNKTADAAVKICGIKNSAEFEIAYRKFVEAPQ